MGELWTLDQVAAMIERLTGVQHQRRRACLVFQMELIDYPRGVAEALV